MIICYVLRAFCIVASTIFNYWILLGLRLLACLDTFLKNDGLISESLSLWLKSPKVSAKKLP
jgi:hypothetical protein